MGDALVVISRPSAPPFTVPQTCAVFVGIPTPDPAYGLTCPRAITRIAFCAQRMFWAACFPISAVHSSLSRAWQEGRRSDGRTPTDIRPIETSCGVLPRVHGSALFTRGETQVGEVDWGLWLPLVPGQWSLTRQLLLVIIRQL